jgi:hypothetical protein
MVSVVRKQKTEDRGRKTDGRCQKPEVGNMRYRAWGKGHGAKGMGQRAWGKGHRAQGIGHRRRAEGKGHGVEGIGQKKSHSYLLLVAG